MKRNKHVITLLALIIVAVIGTLLVVKQVVYVTWAHRTLANYESFRGCETMLTTTDTDATCRLKDGSTIKLVKFQDRWYLDGDLPWCRWQWCL